MLDLKIEIQGITKLDAKFSNIGRSLNNLREPLMKADALIKKAMDMNFVTSGRELGKPWQPLKQSTIKRKGSSEILIDTGRMRKGFQSTITPMSATIRNNTQYFKFHQSIAARRKLPRRVMMRIDQKRESEIIRVFSAYINKVAKER